MSPGKVDTDSDIEEIKATCSTFKTVVSATRETLFTKTPLMSLIRQAKSPAYLSLLNDPNLENFVVAAGNALLKSSLAIHSQYRFPSFFRLYTPASVSNSIVTSSCSLGYSGVSRLTNSLLESSSPLGSANLASAIRK